MKKFRMIDNDNHGAGMQCLECKDSFGWNSMLDRLFYCPICGAKMEGVIECRVKHQKRWQYEYSKEHGIKEWWNLPKLPDYQHVDSEIKVYKWTDTFRHRDGFPTGDRSLLPELNDMRTTTNEYGHFVPDLLEGSWAVYASDIIKSELLSIFENYVRFTVPRHEKYEEAEDSEYWTITVRHGDRTMYYGTYKCTQKEGEGEEYHIKRYENSVIRECLIHKEVIDANQNV